MNVRTVLQRAVLIAAFMVCTQVAHGRAAQVAESRMTDHTLALKENAGLEAIKTARATGASHLRQEALLTDLGLIYEAEGKESEAMAQFRQASELLSGKSETDDFEVAQYLSEIAKNYIASGRHWDAERLLQRALPILGHGPPRYIPQALATSDMLTAAYMEEGLYGEAEQVSKQAVDLAEKQPIIRLRAEELDNLAAVYMHEAKYAKSMELYKRALGIWAHVTPSQDSQMAVALTGLAADYGNVGKFKQAQELVQKALRFQSGPLKPAAEESAIALNNIATVYVMHHRYSDAIPLLGRALAVESTTAGTGQSLLSVTLSNLAIAYYDEGEYARAAPLFERSVSLMQAILPGDSPRLGAELAYLAAAYSKQHLYPAAQSLSQRSINLLESSSPKDYPSLILALKVYAFVLAQTGKEIEAEPFQTRAAVYLAKYKESVRNQ